MPINANINPSQPANPMSTPPVAAYGTLALSDLLAVNNTSVIDFGRQDVFEAIRLYFAEMNAVVNEQLGLFTARTTQRAKGVGGPVRNKVVFTDEFGVADAQKVTGVGQMGFPLVKHQYDIQWTYQWMRKHTPQEMAVQAQEASLADVLGVQFMLRRSIFTPTNYVWVDRLRDYMTVYPKAFANADGFPIPASPAGTVFDATTHSHYTGTTNAFPSNADIGTLIANVTEHFSNGQVYLFVPLSVGTYIYQNRVASYPDFAPLVYTDQTYSLTLTLGNGVLNPTNQANRQIGFFNGAAVWVKPWVPDGAIFAFIDGPEKPVAMRVPDDLGGDNGDFRALWDDDTYPNMCQLMEREYGFAVNNRVAGACLSYNGPNTTYVTPTINQ